MTNITLQELSMQQVTEVHATLPHFSTLLAEQVGQNLQDCLVELGEVVSGFVHKFRNKHTFKGDLLIDFTSAFVISSLFDITRCVFL